MAMGLEDLFLKKLTGNLSANKKERKREEQNVLYVWTCEIIEIVLLMSFNAMCCVWFEHTISCLVIFIVLIAGLQ